MNQKYYFLLSVALHPDLLLLQDNFYTIAHLFLYKFIVNYEHKEANPKVDFVKNEHEILDYWSKNKTFEKLVEKNSNGPKWSFLDGPIC